MVTLLLRLRIILLLMGVAMLHHMPSLTVVQNGDSFFIP